MKRFIGAALPVVAGILAVPPIADASEPGIIDALRDRGATVLSLGTHAGLDSYWVEPVKTGDTGMAAGDSGYALHVTADGHAVMGLMFDPAGNLLPLLPGDQNSPDATAALRAQAAFSVGDQALSVFLFADPACPWSRSAVARLARHAIDGTLQLHVIPVALLGEQSARMAIAVYAASDPVAAWFDGHASGWSRRAAERVTASNTLFNRHGTASVPLALWRENGVQRHYSGDAADEWISIIVGARDK